MNDEDISKMAVMLLNCQSAIEGRRIYHCTNEMSIKDCTHSMDADTWNTYHLMTNRVRAVCYTARQSQFIGLTEHTINRLVDTTRNQVKTLDKIVNDQKDLQNLAEETLDSVKEGMYLIYIYFFYYYYYVRDLCCILHFLLKCFNSLHF